MSDEQRSQGYSPRQTRGTYTYGDGDWTYEELSEQKATFVRELREIQEALGMPGFHVHEDVLDAIERMRNPWWFRLKRALGFGRARG